MLIYQYVVVRLSSQYGNLRAMPVGPMATVFAKIAGAKTLTPAALRAIDELGLPIMADGSTADLRAMERLMQANSSHPALYHPVLIEYRAGSEEELTGDMQAHLDHKAEHGT